jgi:hypothetical protein
MGRFVLNAMAIVSDGKYSVKTINSEDAVTWVEAGPFVTAIGHEGTAIVASEMLGREIKADRIFVDLQPGDEALVLKLNGRLPEGKVLSAEELRDFPKEWKILRREA